jgi:hypothetical protein
MKRRSLLAVTLAILVVSCDAEPPAPTPPRLLAADKMVGALHISWENPTSGCDAIELERRYDGTKVAGFALLHKLSGAADNKHDATATEDLTYGYRLRCEKATRYSAYSNELSANPQR